MNLCDQGMEYETQAPLARTSLLLLNDDSLLDIFEFLQIEDSVNLAETCSRLSDVGQRNFEKYSKFDLKYEIAMKGQKYINHIFNHIGHYVSSLKIDCSDSFLNLSEIVGETINNYENIKSLRIDKWKGETYQNVQPMYNFDNVETLTMRSCTFERSVNFNCFLQNFHKLKCVNCLFCYNISDPLEMIFENNQDIASFLDWFNQSKNHNFLNLTHKIEKCCICYVPPLITMKSVMQHYPYSGLMHFEQDLDSRLRPILKFDQLTKLKLFCDAISISDFLRELPSKGIIEELVLESVDDDTFYYILTTFHKLEVLGIVLRSYRQLKSSINWPAKLKHLRLSRCEMTYIDFIAIVQKLKRIERIDLNESRIVKGDEIYFSDVITLSGHILDVIDKSDKKQRLDLVLPDCAKPLFYHSKEFVIDSKLLRILHKPSKSNPLDIDVIFSLL